MNIFQKIKALFVIKKSINNIEEAVKMNKPFYLSTRFWGTVATNVGTIITACNGWISPQTATMVLAVVNCIYTIMKTLEAQPSITTLVDNSTTNVPK
jgi:cobalamin biosynthesis protein CobD/CbiB